MEALLRRSREIEKRRTNLARVVAALDDPEVSAPPVAELKALADQKPAFEADCAVLVERRQAVEADHRWCGRVAGYLPHLTYQERRDLLAALGCRSGCGAATTSGGGSSAWRCRTWPPRTKGQS